MRPLKIIILLLFFTLVGIRIAMPHYLLKYVENQINKIPEYRVKIADLDVHLIRGAYTLKDIQLWKMNKTIPIPFYQAKAMDFSIEWRALLHGKLVAKIWITQPQINFVTDPSHENEQLNINKQWLDLVKSLYPLNINSLYVDNGQISLTSYKGNPPFKIDIRNANFSMQNMQKATQTNKTLSSSFLFTGETKGEGHIDLRGQFNPFAKAPEFNLQTKLTSLQVRQIASFLRHYSSIDVSKGNFSMYAEIAAAKGSITGYIKPFIKNLEISPPANNTNPIRTVIDGAANIASKVLSNSNQKTIATKIKVSGDINDPDTSILSILGYLLRHGFIQALLPQIDKSVKMEDLLYSKQVRKNSTVPQYRG